MLGWGIEIYREVPGGRSKEALLASWHAGLGGLDWIEALVKQGHAIDLGGDGYPCHYKVTVANLLPSITSGPPLHTGPMVIGDDYVLPAGWIGNVRIDYEKIAACSPDEWLVIEAWDQS